MLNEFRSTYITWDKATRRIYSPITANESDSNGRKLNIQVVNSGQVDNLTGTTLHLYWETKDKMQHGLDAFTASDISKGEFEIFYTTGMLSNVGDLNATLVLVDATGKVVSDWFKITVARGINESAIESENSFSSLTQALIDISNLEQNYAPRLNDLTAQLQQTDGRVSEIIANAGNDTLPTEVVDMRTVLGKTYITAGDALRAIAEHTIPLTWTNGYITSSNHTNGEGKIVTSSGGRYSNIFTLPKGAKIRIHAGGGNTVSVLSKWTTNGTYVDELIVGDGINKDYDYVVSDTFEHLRVTTLIATVPQSEVFVKITSTDADVLNPVYDSIESLNEDVSDVKNVYNKINLSYAEGSFVVSKNHSTFTEGSLGTSTDYVVSNIFTLNQGEQIKIYANGSPNVLVLSKWTDGGEFSSPLIVGDNSTKEYLYTATDSIEYLRVSNNITIVPKENLFVGKSYPLGEMVSNLSNEFPNLQAKVDSLEVNASTPNPEMVRLPVINFQFDDGLPSDVNVVNKFKTYGFRCGFAIHSSNTRLEEYKSYQDDGFEILSHSTDAGGFNDDTKALSWYKNKMKTSKETLEANGFDVKGWVTPSSQMLDSAIPLLKNFYEYAFTQYLGEWTGTTTPQNVFSEDTRRLKRVSMQSTTVENCINAIDKTIVEGGILTFYAHKFPDTDLTDAKLTAILEHLKLRADSGDCLVLKPVDAYKHYYTLRHSDLVGLLH